ncbi:hypothetical protein [Pseudomonas shahriarae]|uniref:hypothetical protein n=1 Tax=Pseudomonas shahriarae TaxID=2745512 RepID=UPI00235DFFB9|nr:hypothetical protein [Pseudomonas shahriarae]MDD0980404.1 hypothetical protein [Pseudomonas shahriarae]
MAKRASKAEQALYGWLFIIGLIVAVPVYLFDKVNKSVGWQIPAAVIAALLVLAILMNSAKRRARLKCLRDRYHDESIVQNILARQIWVGQTAEQLTDSLGPPVATDHKFLKTKNRDIWKYHRNGVNRYGLRVTVEDGYVTAWDKKSR